MKRLLKAPTGVNLELTEVCNLSCRHCYNYWRGEGQGRITLTRERVDRLVERFQEAGIFHVVLSGGEPLTRMDILEYALARFSAAGFSLSLNSNLVLASSERAARLVDAGLDHVLTSLNSHRPDAIDAISQIPGTFERILKGIENAVSAGLRVSVNMILQESNRADVYETGRLAASLGCQRIFGTRWVPPVWDPAAGAENLLGARETRECLDALLAVKRKTGIMVGSLVSYPLCFLGDLERYADFVGRGCPSKSGHRLSVNADGQTHICVHEEQAYGNVFAEPIEEIYRRAAAWWSGEYRHSSCQGCDYLDLCESGCSMIARGLRGGHDGGDPLMVGPQAAIRPLAQVHDPAVLAAVTSGQAFRVPERLRFRWEDGFALVNIRWANTISVPMAVGAFLYRAQAAGECFSLDEFPSSAEDLAALYYKDALEAPAGELGARRDRDGLSLNLESMPGKAA